MPPTTWRSSSSERPRKIKRLCRDGVVERTVYPTTPPQTDYRLTPMGESLAGMVSALADRSRENKDAIGAARSRWDREPR